MIGIVTAMPEERAALTKALQGVVRSQHDGLWLYRGRLAERDICVVEGGMGAAAAFRATKALFLAGRPSLVISAGYCGAVRPGPVAGDLVVCSNLFTADSVQLQELPLPGSAQVAARLSAELQRHGLRTWQGSFITTSGIVTKSSMSDRLPRDTPHPVLEMESAAVAQAAGEAQIPFVGLRAVSDDSSEELQFSLEEICGEDRQVAVARVLWLLARRPLLLAQFLRLAAGSAKAGKNLGRALERIVRIL